MRVVAHDCLFQWAWEFTSPTGICRLKVVGSEAHDCPMGLGSRSRAGGGPRQAQVKGRGYLSAQNGYVMPERMPQSRVGGAPRRPLQGPDDEQRPRANAEGSNKYKKSGPRLTV